MNPETISAEKQQECWEHMATWPKKYWEASCEHWDNLIRERRLKSRCEGCPIQLICSCKREYCQHHCDLHCNLVDVCVYCDTFCQPYTCNPINLDKAIKYCPYNDLVNDFKKRKLQYQMKKAFNPLLIDFNQQLEK